LSSFVPLVASGQKINLPRPYPCPACSRESVRSSDK
jgi:hypothetical protein